jgi:hypothetical protein
MMTIAPFFSLSKAQAENIPNVSISYFSNYVNENEHFFLCFEKEPAVFPPRRVEMPQQL